MSQEQNKAQVILVSFFGAMVTVMEKVQPGFVCPQKGTENNVAILQWNKLWNTLPLPTTTTTGDFMLSETLIRILTADLSILRPDLLATLKTNASEINNATI